MRLVLTRYKGLWAEIQRERERLQRVRQWEYREARRAEAAAAKAEWERKRQAAATEKERKKFYVEDRKAEAAALSEDVRARVVELDGPPAGRISESGKHRGRRMTKVHPHEVSLRRGR